MNDFLNVLVDAANKEKEHDDDGGVIDSLWLVVDDLCILLTVS
jgi:hypothetical protein